MRQNAKEVELFLPGVLVTRHRWTHGRPMPGSVVVRKDTGMPGDGYFKGACRLVQFDPDGKNDNRAFWAEGLERVYDY
jgi:hypothetical protein